MIKKLTYLFLSIILLGASFVRLYRIDATQTFLEDEGRDMLIVRRMIETKLPVLLGPQTSTGNMYLGPVYYYFITPALILSQGNPVGPAIMIALTGVLTVYLLYYFASKWFGRLAGLTSAALYAFLPYPVMFTRNSWNPNLVPLIMLLLLYSASKIDLSVKKGWWKPVLTFGILAGILMQLHYMALVGVGSCGIYILLSNYKHIKKLTLSLALGFVGLVVALSPFIAFEVRNQFVNTHALVGFLTGTTEKNIKYDISLSQWNNRMTNTYRDIVSGQFGSMAFHEETARHKLASACSILLLLLVVFAAKKSKETKLLLITFASSLFVLAFYQEYIHLHYLGFLLPVSYLLVGAGVRGKFSRWFFIIFTLFALIYNSKTLIGYITSSSTNQVTKAREIAAYIGKSAGDRPYNVVMRSLGQTSPFQYFLSWEKNRPSNTQEETLFVICDGSPCNKDDETTTLLYLTGPSHPSLASYLGHPQMNEFRGERHMLNNQIVNYGIWVAEFKVSKE